MNHFTSWIYFPIIFFIIICTNCRRTQINVHDDFESPKLNKIWSAKRMERHSFKIQSCHVKTGKSAAEITLRTGDVVETATVRDKASERDELMETYSLFSIEGTKYEYQFSMFLPDSFPIRPVRLIIAQWKQFCPACKCSEYSPVLAVRYFSGKLFITLQTDSDRQTLYELNKEIRNCWLDFKFQIRFSRQNDGEVKVFLDDNEIVNYKGKTSYSESCGLFSKKNRYYFKMGLYRDRMAEPMTIFIDKYQKKELIE